MELPKDMVTADQLCRITNFTDVFHRQLGRLGYLPPPVNGMYRLVPTIGGVIKYLKEKLDKGATPERLEREKKLKKQNTLLDIAIAKEQGSLIDAGEVTREWQRVFMIVRTRLLQLPSRLGPRLMYGKDQAGMAAEIEKEIHLVLSEFAKEGEQAT
jgi:hypothetical protein